MGQIIIIPDLCTEGNYNTMADVCLSVRLSVACLELTRANSEAIRPYGAILELGRYRYLESVSVFGIFVGIFSCLFGIRYRSVFLKYWLKIANFWYPTYIWRPC